MEIFCISRICSDKKLTRLQENLQPGFMHKILRVIFVYFANIRRSREPRRDRRLYLDILSSDRKSDEIFIDSAVVELLRGELAMSCASRVQAAGAAVRNMGNYRCELEAVHESDRVLSAAFYSQRNDAAGAVGHILLRKVIVFVSLKSGVADGLDLRMSLQELCNGESV